jgi:hypothetical protein
MSEHKFKVGDMVKVKSGISNLARANELGIIVEDDKSVRPYHVNFDSIDNEGYYTEWYYKSDLELVSVDNRLKLIENSSSKIKNLYSQVLNTKSLDSQIVQLSAEHSELMVELSRLSRNRDDSCYKKIASELVDLEIMVNEFKFYLIEHLKVVNQSEYDLMMEQAINKFDNILNGDK